MLSLWSANPAHQHVVGALQDKCAFLEDCCYALPPPHANCLICMQCTVPKQIHTSCVLHVGLLKAVNVGCLCSKGAFAVARRVIKGNTVITCRHNTCIVKGANSLPVAGEISASFSQPTNVAASHGIADLTLSSNAKKSAPRANMESICSSPEHSSVQPS